jgi:predicted nucleic acid-binding protein
MQNARATLIDTSAWIEYLRKTSHSAAKAVENHLKMDSGILCGAVVGELLQGAKSEKEIDLIADLCGVCTMIREGQETWRKAGLLAKKLRKKGHIIPLLDCYIYILAEENHAVILSLDQHFSIIGKLA